MRATRTSRSVAGRRSGAWIALVMMPVMISVTRRTMSAFSICAVPNERTMAAVTSGYSRSDRFAPRNTDTTRATGVASRGGCTSR